MKLTISEEQRSQYVSEYQNPFKSDKVEKILMVIQKHTWDEKIRYWANVTFKNGNTEGQQKIEAENFTILVAKVESFIKELI